MDFRQALDDYPDSNYWDLVQTLYNSEDNFNNGDKTSEQRVYTEGQVAEELTKAVLEMIESQACEAI